MLQIKFEYEKEGLSIKRVFIFYLLILALLMTLGSFLQYKYQITGILYVQIFIILFPSIFILYISKVKFSILRLKTTGIFDYLGSIGLWAVGFVVIMIYSSIQNHIFPSWAEDLELLGKFLSEASYFQSIFILSLVPAFCEEIFFRGFIYGNIEKHLGYKNAIIISSIMFGIFHIYPAKIVVTSILGMFFAYAVYLTGSIYTSMLMHFINNSFTLLLGKNISNTDFIQNKFIFIFSVFFIFILIGINWHNSKQKNK